MQARQTIVFAGDFASDTDWVIAQTSQQTTLADRNNTLWVTSSELTNSNYTYLPHNKIRTILGCEFNLIVYDALDGFYPDAFGAVAGTLRAGGALILLLPDFLTLSGRFMQRLVQIINTDESITVITQENITKNKAVLSYVETPANNIQTTADQHLAIAAIKKVAKGHRRRPLVITADRGRGKSAALGIAAGNLLAESLQTIIVTSPAKRSAEIVFKHADNTKGLRFIAPDELIQQLPKTDLLLIDEAAAIPTPILTKLLKHYSRIVFSTTQHGYEGTGRGFDIRFKQELNQQTPSWRSIQLKTPIRWADNDPLEKFVFKALLLNADQSNTSNTETSDLCVEKINRDALVKNEKTLSQLFGLLVTAHYQTKPSDLQYLLDDKALSIYIIKYKDCLLATALTATEGGFDKALAEDIYAGRRRPKGHLIPQSLAFHSGIREAAQLTGERIIRIAVHSDFQRQGLATQLIKVIQQDSFNKDYIGASFAASIDMLTFWEKQNFKPVRLGLTRDASSGTHSIIELLPLSDNGDMIFRQLRKQFQYSLLHLLSEPLRNLESETIEPLFTIDIPSTIQLENWQWKELSGFITTNRGYEVCMASLWGWFTQFIFSSDFSKLDRKDRALLITKILQQKAWQELVDIFNFSGKKSAQTHFKAAVSNGLLSTSSSIANDKFFYKNQAK